MTEPDREEETDLTAGPSGQSPTLQSTDAIVSGDLTPITASPPCRTGPRWIPRARARNQPGAVFIIPPLSASSTVERARHALESDRQADRLADRQEIESDRQADRREHEADRRAARLEIMTDRRAVRLADRLDLRRGRDRRDQAIGLLIAAALILLTAYLLGGR